MTVKRRQPNNAATRLVPLVNITKAIFDVNVTLSLLLFLVTLSVDFRNPDSQLQNAVSRFINDIHLRLISFETFSYDCPV